MKHAIDSYVCPTLVLVLLLGTHLVGCDSKKTDAPSQSSVSAATTATVTLEFVIKDKTVTEQVDVLDGTTLESVLRDAKKVDIEMSGSGTTAFVNSINDLATSGGEGWTFEIDGEWADKGVGAIQLHPPTTVTWKFGEFQ